MREHTVYLTGDRYNGSLLEEANEILLKADTNPQRVRARLLSIGLVFLGGVMSTVGVLIVIGTGVPVSEQARALTLLLLVLSVVVSLAALLSVLLTLWTSFVHERVKTIIAQSEVADISAQNFALVEAAAGIGNDAAFRSDLVNLVVEFARPRPGLRAAEIAEIVATVSAEPVFTKRLFHLIRGYLVRDTDLASLMEGAGKESVRSAHREPEKAVSRTI
jgi:hypothetical protein